MCQTFFSFPAQFHGWPVFGFGLFLAAWSLLGVAIFARMIWRQGLTADTWSEIGMFALFGGAMAFVPIWFDLLSKGRYNVPGYGILLLVAVVSAVLLSVRRARQMGQDPEMIFSLGTWLFVAGIAGARLFYVIQYRDRFSHLATWGETIKSAVNVAQGGLVVYGSLLAGGLAFFIFCRKHRLPSLALADVIVPGLVLGMGIGRVGCFMNGCCYGGLSDLPWAVEFPRDSPPSIEQLRSGKLALDGLRFNAAAGDDPAAIASVAPGSAAAAQGLKVGDTIVAIDEKSVDSVDQAIWLLMHPASPGEIVELRVAEHTQSFAWNVAAPRQGSPPRLPESFFKQLRSGEASLEGLKFNGAGYGPPIIAEIEAGSAAADQGVQPGATIIDVNDRPVRSLDEAIALLSRLKAFPRGAEIRLRVADAPRVCHLTLEPPPEHSLPVHPAQLYSAIDATLLCLFLLAYSPFHRRDGELLALAITIHPISRFLLEIVRVDEAAILRTTLSISQLISIGILLGAAVLWSYILLRPRRLVWGPVSR